MAERSVMRTLREGNLVLEGNGVVHKERMTVQTSSKLFNHKV